MGGEVDANRSAPRTTGNPEPAMAHLDTLISPPAIAVTYLFLRLLVPVLLIAMVSRGATPAQRISLVRTYLLSPPRHIGGPRFRTSQRGQEESSRPTSLLVPTESDNSEMEARKSPLVGSQPHPPTTTQRSYQVQRLSTWRATRHDQD